MKKTAEPKQEDVLQTIKKSVAVVIKEAETMPIGEQTKERVKKMTDPEEHLICGKTDKEIRTAFFKHKVNDLLSEIQIETPNVSVSDLQELYAYMEMLQDQNSEIVKEALDLFGGEIVGSEMREKPPTVDDLKKGVSDKEWRAKADAAISYIQSTMDSVRRDLFPKAGEKPKHHPHDFWMNTVLTFISYEDLIDRDRVFKDQCYRARMTEIIDDCGISRKEAEERAKLTEEYSAYKNAVLFKDRMNEWIFAAKKKSEQC